jgi:transposase
VIPIEETKRVNWRNIRAEYISGGISYREIAKKYDIPFGTVRHRAQVENWVREREIAEHNVNTMSAQRTAAAAADNAVIAADIKKRLLLRLKRIEEKYPFDATEIRTHEGKSTVTFRIRDLTAAYKDLTDDIQSIGTDKNAPIYELLRKLDGECDV